MPFKARKAVFDKLLEVADVASLSRDERIQSIKQSGDSLRRSRLIFLNYLPVITRLFHDYLPDCLAGLDDVEAGGQILSLIHILNTSWKQGEIRKQTAQNWINSSGFCSTWHSIQPIPPNM